MGLEVIKINSAAKSLGGAIIVGVFGRINKGDLKEPISLCDPHRDIGPGFEFIGYRGCDR